MNGIANGFTVKATGKNENNETTDYAAGGFYGQANSTKTRESHVTNLKSVTADTSTSDGIAGGFVASPPPAASPTHLATPMIPAYWTTSSRADCCP